jgi:PET Domain/LIM domain
MLEIPENQRPISGTEGAQRRREQLEHQVPPHDVDPTKCHSLTAEEIVGLENYRQHLKEGVVGQGRVATLANMLKDMGLTYGALAQDGSLVLGPSAANTLDSVNKNLDASAKSRDYCLAETENDNEFFPPPPSPQTLANMEAPQFPKSAESASSNFLKRPSAYLPTPYCPPKNLDSTNSNILASEPVSSNDEYSEKGDSKPLVPILKTPSTKKGVTFAEVQTPANVAQQFSNAPVKALRFDNNNSEGDLPAELAGLQLTDSCKIIEGKCMECSLPVSPGDVVVTAERAGTGAFWHPACFVCSTCQVRIVFKH